MRHTRRIDGMARCKIVGAIQHDICLRYPSIKVCCIGLEGMRINLNVGIDLQHGSFERCHFQLPHTRIGVGNLAL